LDCWKVLDLGEAVLGKSQGLRVKMVFYGKPSMVGGDRKIPQGMVKEL